MNRRELIKSLVAPALVAPVAGSALVVEPKAPKELPHSVDDYYTVSPLDAMGLPIAGRKVGTATYDAAVTAAEDMGWKEFEVIEHRSRVCMRRRSPDMWLWFDEATDFPPGLATAVRRAQLSGEIRSL